MDFKEKKISALEAISKANWIAFAPVVFQASRALSNLGILNAIGESKKEGLSLEEIKDQTNLSQYAVRVLCEAGLAIELLSLEEDKYTLTKTACFFLNDRMTQVNTEFIHDVCYKGLFDLEKALLEGKPEGLKVFGDFPTIYEGLSKLDEPVQKSWFDFDHFYSDTSYSEILPKVFQNNPKKILDIGGNTGKFSFRCLDYNPNVELGIVDLKGQLDVAKNNASDKGLSHRMNFYERDVLKAETKFPEAYDIIWMSQFLDCFSEDQIVSILQKCVEAMDDNSEVIIMELFWDRQKFEASRFSLIMGSLYFTSMANGNSQFYSYTVFKELLEKAGLYVEEVFDHIGISHTLLRCKKKNNG
ncbi:MAG: class I SAM-dependent methyltransferase [Bacteroidales bacterium]